MRGLERPSETLNLAGYGRDEVQVARPGVARIAVAVVAGLPELDRPEVRRLGRGLEAEDPGQALPVVAVRMGNDHELDRILDAVLDVLPGDVGRRSRLERLERLWQTWEPERPELLVRLHPRAR